VVKRWIYLITFNLLNSAVVMVGGISPLLILSITSKAIVAASCFVLNPSLPGSVGMLWADE
jgi:hypothetical protein